MERITSPDGADLGRSVGESWADGELLWEKEMARKAVEDETALDLWLKVGEGVNVVVGQRGSREQQSRVELT